MKIVIVGAGALGTLLAALLSKTKSDIWILEKDKARANVLSRDGITVEGLSNFKAQVKATTDHEEIGSADLVIISVKSYNTKEASLCAKPLISDNTAVLTLQNGIGNIEVISEVAGAERVLGGVTNLGATLLGTGKVRYAGKGETTIGRMDGQMPVVTRSVREIFNKAGLDTKISRDIKGVLWSKLIINAGINALTALTRLPNGKLVEFEGTRKLMREASAEAVKVAKRKRIKLIYDDPLAKVEAVCEATSANISSMLQDILKKKRTEIDFINGVIVRHGQELGVPVPVNSMLVDLVKSIEAGYSYLAAE